MIRKDREFAVINGIGVVLVSGNYDKVYERWEKVDKGLLVEILEEK